MAATEDPNAGHSGCLWICSACGKHTALGAPRTELRDASCYSWAVLVYPQTETDKAQGRWRAVDGQGDLIT